MSADEGAEAADEAEVEVEAAPEEGEDAPEAGAEVEDGAGGVADDGPAVPTAAAVLDYLAKALVADPDAVKVEVEDDGGGVTLSITVADGDLGRLIGRRGRVANSVRALGRAAAAKDGHAGVAIEFVE